MQSQCCLFSVNVISRALFPLPKWTVDITPTSVYLSVLYFSNTFRRWEIHCRGSLTVRGKQERQLMITRRMWLSDTRKQSSSFNPGKSIRKALLNQNKRLITFGNMFCTGAHQLHLESPQRQTFLSCSLVPFIFRNTVYCH